MEQQVLRTLYWKNATAMNYISNLVAAVRCQNMYQVNGWTRAVTKALQECMKDIMVCMNELQQLGLPWDSNYLVSVLSQIEEASKQEDYVLLGDLYELQMVPALQEVQVIICGLDIDLILPEWWEGNLEVLRIRNPEIHKALLAVEASITDDDVVAAIGLDKKMLNHTQYSVEPTSVGYFTLALEENNKRWYLHSNRNPLEEAKQWVDRNYRLERERYTLFGWGMGYHVRKLLQVCTDMDLVVIEPDINILYYALKCGDWRNELQQVRLVWDTEWKTIGDLITEEREVLLFRPELPHIQNEKIRELLLQMADRKDAIADVERVFYQNIRENIRSCQGYVDSVAERIKGKRVVIVAGGPSLDKNVELLKDKSEDVVILAVGTVYKLLLKKGIAVDFVVVSDAKVYYQLEGIETIDADILLLATADRRISKNCNGNVYLVCQKDYQLAADYARSKGYTCYASGGSVATLALDIAIRQQAKEIAFIGLDLAYYGNQMHASGTARERFSGAELHREKAWDGSEVNTSQTFLRFRKWLEKRIQEPDATMKIIDATEGGLAKRGFIPMTLTDYLGNENDDERRYI